MSFSYSCLLRPCVASLLLAFAGNVMAGGLVERDFDWDEDFVYDGHNPLMIHNEYWPLIPVTSHTYLADEDDECELNTVTVWPGQKDWGDVENDDYDNIWARIVHDKEWAAEMECDEAIFPAHFELMEETFDWYAQDIYHNIWYLGEYTVAYDHEGECDNWVNEHDPKEGCEDGSFQAGVDGAEAGIVMLGSPFKGAFYQQEYYEEEAEDMGKVLNFVPVETDFGEYEDCLKTKEWTPLEPGEIEHKYYCVPDGLVLIEELHGGTKDVELIDIDFTVP